ncbi:uncharacterized protein EV154DRAFT_470454 [Mucor mucedo]|uniref:uncharacterized protein n=1 Tax=Mucor mucedo TaxID=29922 RepID=UPI00221E570B|nr:uncharacterized protein EV154DRAFT_470454 [Mucor mucedo]KAI7886361.1 hypothetical protein EV154DRAFT_470454 [Mucor mucedo]
MSQSMQTADMSNLIHRLKARLALANYKREHGYENVDLRTLESSLYQHKVLPTATASITTTTTTTGAGKPTLDKKRRKLLLSHHRFYPTSPPLQHNDMDRLIKKNASRATVHHVPLSETRLQHHHILDDNRKLSATLSSDDEDAAHLLVLMHQSPTMAS